MWKQILTKFIPKPEPLSCDAVKLEVEVILKLDLTTESARKEHGDTVLKLLNRMLREIEKVEKRANGYPRNPISGDVWLAGAGYGNLAFSLTEHFQKAGWLKREENASALWAKAVLAVCAHYHHMVGPAMIANADCNDRLGNGERATDLYKAVVGDFTELLEYATDEAEELTDETVVALKALETATDRLLKRGISRVEGIDLLSVQARAKQAIECRGGGLQG